MNRRCDVSALIGLTLTGISAEVGDDLIVFIAGDRVFNMYHAQDCCESVQVEDITGDVADLVGSPIVMAEEVSGYDHPDPEGAGSCTWTFYKLATAKGYVTIRWLGQSNGYYSESVDFEEVAT